MKPLRLLMVEDNPDDEALVVMELRRNGFAAESHRVQTADALREALHRQDWDIILSDYSMPRFTALDALAVLRDTGRDIPFIVVSGSIGEDEAVEAMRAGARDYFAKDRLVRLGAAVERELREAEARREHAREELDRVLLAQSSEALAEPLDLDERLKRLVRIPVPRVADWCVIFLHERARGGLRLAALAHPDAEREARAWAMDQRFTAPLDAQAGPARVLATGEPEWVEDVSKRSVPVTRDAEHQREVDRLGLRSVVYVPLRGRASVLGVLGLATSGERRLGAADLTLARELGRRVGLVLENARLFREAQDAVRLRDEFLTVAAHELRTPLTTLRLQLGSMLAPSLRGPPAPELVTRLERSLRQVRRLGTLVEGLLDVSRLSSGELRLAPERFDLAELVREVTGRYRPEAVGVGCELRVSGEPGIWGRWDRVRVDQAVAALVSNALKFGPGKPVEVDVETVGPRGRVCVRDRGIGIQEDQLELIFERFGRAVSSRSYGGLGLGLYLARRSAEAHGGRAWAEPREGGGACFTLELPLEKEMRE
ncbi:hybrid sensor histidine kinase/response regulator [Pyxidicoccus xibeiensis]|uniref:hybrid sensor histidine kinase/response regulator n=1 Tax=Pyxidicoccus xibeiensis TaxID=2906759 RepID=UPI0020A71C64|nr:ATP-binding protein [Pyxidicoccus xibeiensis]MCP3136714.1 ATP-binding protein [Pyxidicoccus xibeiensis]